MSETIGIHGGPHDGQAVPDDPASSDTLVLGGSVYEITPGGTDGHHPHWHYCHRPHRRA